MVERKRLFETLCGYYEESGENFVHYFTDDEAEMLADYLILNNVIAPPCNIGDTVWKIENVWHLDDEKTHAYHYEREVLEFRVRSISISCNSKGIWTKKFRICEVINGKTTGCQRDVEFNDFGKTVFPFREDAEQVLKGEIGNE